MLQTETLDVAALEGRATFPQGYDVVRLARRPAALQLPAHGLLVEDLPAEGLPRLARVETLGGLTHGVELPGTLVRLATLLLVGGTPGLARG